MTNRNSNKHLFTALASAGLCLSLGFMASGCSDAGSTAVNNFITPKAGTVNFSYSSIGDLTQAKYAFYNEAGYCVLATDKLDLEKEISIPNVPKEAAYVNAYYFESDTVSSIGVDNISWITGEDYRVCSIDSPDFSIDAADLTFEVYPDRSVIDVNETDRINLTGCYKKDDVTKFVDMSPLASMTLDGKIVASKFTDVLSNNIKALDYGRQNIIVSAPEIAGYTESSTTVYITDAVLESITIEDKETSLDEIINVVNPNIDFGVTPLKFGTDTVYNVKTGAVQAIGHYKTDNPKAENCDVPMRSSEVSWITPNSQAINFDILNTEVSYLAREAGSNIDLKVYAENASEEKIEASIRFNVLDAETVCEQKVAPLTVDGKDLAAAKTLPVKDESAGVNPYHFDFSLYGSYVLKSGKKSEEVLISKESTSENLEMVSVYVSKDDQDINTEYNENTGAFQVDSGTCEVGTTGTMRLELIETETGTTILKGADYNYTIISNEF